MMLEFMKPNININANFHMKCYSRDKLIHLSYICYIRIGRGGLKERGGLITFFP